ncbi:MAG: M20/M25/M40 family metallo-hydrolase [Gammaproteobacteria bacterium]
MSKPFPSVMERLRALIGTPSVSSVSPEFDQSNRPVIDLLANWLADLGFAIEIMPLPNQPEKANLIATLGQGPGGLVLSGHTDTVPFDASGWQSDPFVLSERDQRLYGLGSADMKAKALVELGRPKARYAVIGEPTGLIPVHLHKGIIMEAVRITGHSGHSSDPSLGNNAIEGMHKAIAEILRWREDLQQRYRDPHFAVPYPTLNLGHIHGGDNPNRICGECELHFDLRSLPGMVQDELRQELDQRLAACFADSGLQVSQLPLITGTEAMHTDSQADIVQQAETLTGYQAEAVAYCTEGPYLNQLGMQTIILGPGHIEQAHQPDEFLPMEQIRPTIDLITQMIQRYCHENA